MREDTSSAATTLRRSWTNEPRTLARPGESGLASSAAETDSVSADFASLGPRREVSERAGTPRRLSKSAGQER